jgi:hypothetical protein
MQWLGSGAGINSWKSSRCVGSLTLGGRTLKMFRGGVNRKHICGKQTITKRRCTNMKHIVYYCDHLSGCRLCDANWSRVGSTTIFEFEPRISLSPLFATSIPSCIIAPLSHRLSSASSAHWRDIVIHTSCHVHIPSFAVILKSALFAAVPLRHFLTTCGLPHILLLTNSPTVL